MTLTWTSQQRSFIKNSAGFTLLELMVATFLMGIVSVALAAVLHNSLRSWRRSAKEVEIHQEAQALLEQMGREFSSAMEVPGADWPMESHQVSFAVAKGSPDHITKVTYRTVSPMTLERTEAALNPQAWATSPIEIQTSYLASVEWAFAFRSGESGRPLRWEKEWKMTGALPAGVRMVLTLKDQDGSLRTYTRTLFSPARELTPWVR